MKYKLLFFLYIILEFSSCHNARTEEVFPAEVNLDEQTQRYRMDKATIERSYLDNIESVRLSQRLKEGFVVNEDSINPEITNGYFIYTSYALRPRHDHKREAYPIRTDARIALSADTITYSRDSLLCMALVIVKVRNDYNPDFEIPSDSCRYDGRAIIVMRKNKDCPFYLFPMMTWSMLGSQSYIITRRELRNFYFNRITSDGNHPCGIGDLDFFNTAQDFIKDSIGRYKFETFYDLGKRYP
ncbi:MAG: hypothetical protein K2L22_00235 [Muribaculaceae bacterium]|nr:hypothetical protein [Muribaculaceae bacterium]